MTLPLTKDVLRAAYNYLNETLPFRRWNLPDGEDVEFRVAKSRDFHGWINPDKRPCITVSRATVGQTSSLLSVLAHEMVHLHQHCTGQRLTHGAAFHKLAAQVCRIHGFDPKTF